MPKIETKPKNLQGVKTIAGLNPKKINSESLLFDDSELYVNKKNRAFLRKMAEFLIGNPDLKVKVIGHTCNRGTDENNQKLSVERAESIIKYLKNQGVDSSRLTAIGEGERKPIADNSTKKGRIKNRRVQFEVIE
ncbi:MAG: OmpA family protein [Leptospiraceae bacterium]|nr:OmpA family protein [Leptospiraceae bacterium]